MHPILFQVGPLTLYSYGAMVAIGFLVAVTLASQMAHRNGWDPSSIQSAAFAALLGGIVGARLTYVALNWDQFRLNLVEILRLDHGGLVFYGGLLAGLLAGIWVLRRAKLPLGRAVDGIIPPFVLGHAVGRVGCFLNGCCYGKPTNLPWAVVFPFDPVLRHPTQLYEGAFLVLLFLFLNRQALLLSRQASYRPGTVLLTYGLLYGTWRFFVEFLRADNPIVAGGLTLFQWISLPLILACGWALFRIRSPQARRQSG